MMAYEVLLTLALGERRSHLWFVLFVRGSPEIRVPTPLILTVPRGLTVPCSGLEGGPVQSCAPSLSGQPLSLQGQLQHDQRRY